MNKKIYFLLCLIFPGLVFAGPNCEEYNKLNTRAEEKKYEDAKRLADYQVLVANARTRCEEEKGVTAGQDQARERDKANEAALIAQGQGVANGTACDNDENAVLIRADKELKTPPSADGAAKPASILGTKSHIQCQHLMGLSITIGESGKIINYPPRDVQKTSTDGKIKCDRPFSYTADYDECVSALASYNFITNSEMFMNLQQTVRTDVKNANIQKKANQEAANGDSQTAMFGAAEESNKHMKQIETEKALAYSAAVAALTKAYMSIPDEDDAIQKCTRGSTSQSFPGKDAKKTASVYSPENCKTTVTAHKPHILANDKNKGAFFEAIAQFTAKGIAAGIKMKQYGNNAQAIAKAKAPIYDDGTDMMVELCDANPADPACITAGNRTTNSGTFGQGDFSFGGDGANNVFGATPEGSEFGELGADTKLDDKNSVAGINSPFRDEAKKAKGVLDPAAAAQTQPGGPNAAPGPGGAGGAGGGGGASLGSDLAAADPDGDKEAQIKTGKVSGSYNMAGGGGFKGIARGKEDANPFASLFDQKGGGVEEDRSIASGDIDGKASGLFEKISRRYGQIQADKRVEAKNLE